MSHRVPAVLVAAGAGVVLFASGAAAAPSGVQSPNASQRGAILRALVKQDGSTSGVTGVYLARADRRLAVACQRTPDAGKVAFLFSASGRFWRYRLSSTTVHASSRVERTLERACLG